MSAPPPSYSNAPLETIDVDALKDSRFMLGARRQLPYRDEAGRICLCLVDLSLKHISTGKVRPPDDIQQRLEKWRKHTVKHFEAQPITWSRNEDGSKWRSSAGETRRTVKPPAPAWKPVAKPPAEAAPPAKSTAGMTDAQLRKHKMEQLANKMKQQREGVAANSLDSKDPVAAASSGGSSSKGLDVARQETSFAGKRQRPAFAVAAAEAEEARAKVAAKVFAATAKTAKEVAKEEAARKTAKEEAASSPRRSRGSGGRPAAAARELPAREKEEEAEAEDEEDEEDEEEEEEEEEEDEEGGALDSVLSRCDDIARQMRSSLAPLLQQHAGGSDGVAGPSDSPEEEEASDSPEEEEEEEEVETALDAAGDGDAMAVDDVDDDAVAGRAAPVQKRRKVIQDSDDDDDDDGAKADAAPAKAAPAKGKQPKPPKKKKSSRPPSSSAASAMSTQPAILNKAMTMAPHQLVGLSWLLGLHRSNASGILADEMGLGKTVQAIALLAQLYEHGEQGPHLIVAPASVLENWRRELATWCPALTTLVYHGGEAQRAAIRDELKHGYGEHGDKGKDYYRVILTSYSIFSSGGDKSWQERRWLSRQVSEGYLVLDEAQQVKNAESARYKSLMELKCTRRLLLTGTPVENSPKELLSLLGFLLPELFSVVETKEEQKRHASKKAKKEMKRKEGLSSLFSALSSDDAQAKARARRIRSLIGPFVLRRLKSHVLDALPPKTEEVVKVDLAPSQAKLYQASIKRIAQQHRDREASHSLSSDFVTSSFTLLRKAALHPMLLPSHYAADPSVVKRIAKILHQEGEYGDPDHLPFERVLAEVQGSSDLTLHLHCAHYKRLHEHALPPERLLDGGKMAHLAELLPKLRAEGHRALIFSQWTTVLDVIGLTLAHLEIRFVRFDGSTDVAERQQLVDAFHHDESLTCFLLTTRAGGLGINLTCADTVILHDSDFNPAADKQAMDRCHRMGQTRPVRVLRLAAAKTVDERIVEIAAAKRVQQDVLLTGDSGADASAGTAEADANPKAASLMGTILRETLFPTEQPPATESAAASAEA